MTEYILVFITASSFQEAENLGKALVEKRLAACGNILSDIRSIFWWKNTITTEDEVLLIVKSRSKLFPEIITTIKSLHSYDVPEIIALPLISGSKDYLNWIDNETQPIQN